MSDSRTHYEVLGLPREATPEQIKRRFRQLAREQHPDVRPEDPTAHEQFLRLNEAYEILNNQSRRAAYDLTLRDQARRGTPNGAAGGVRFGDTYATPGATPAGAPGPSAGAARPSGGPGGIPRRDAAARPQPATARARQERDQRRQEGIRRLDEARLAFRRGHLREAEQICLQVLAEARLGPAHELLGDILDRQGRLEAAANQYTIAAQMTPANGLIMAKFNRVTARIHAVDGGAIHNPVVRQRNLSYQLGISFLGFSLVFFILIWGPTVKSEPLGWSLVEHWTFAHLIFMGASGFISGMVLAAAGWLGQMEHEVLFPYVTLFGRNIRLWLMLLLTGILSFPLTLGAYAFFCRLQQAPSRSVLALLGLSVFLTLGFALLAPDSAAMETVFYGGNIVFTTMLVGWFIGDLFRPAWSA